MSRTARIARLAAPSRTAGMGRGWWLDPAGGEHPLAEGTVHRDYLDAHPEDLPHPSAYGLIPPGWAQVRLFGNSIYFSVRDAAAAPLRACQAFAEGRKGALGLAGKEVVYFVEQGNATFYLDYNAFVHASNVSDLRKLRKYAARRADGVRDPADAARTAARRTAWGGKGWWVDGDGSAVAVGDGSQHFFAVRAHPEAFGVDPDVAHDPHAAYEAVAATWTKARIHAGTASFEVPAWTPRWLRACQAFLFRHGDGVRLVVAQLHDDPADDVEADRDAFLGARSFPQLKRGVAPRGR